MPRLRSLAGVLCALALLATSHGHARADAHEEDPDATAAHASASLTLPSGSLLVFAPIEINLSSDFVAEPISIAPDIWYGVADKLTVGVVHSTVGTTGFFAGGAGVLGSDGAGICVTGEDKGCNEVYDNVGLIVRYGLLDGSFPLAFEAGGLVTAFDPFTVSGRVGITGMYAAGPLSIIFSPNVFIGITEREIEDMDNNKESVNVPITLAVGVGSSMSVGVQTGLTALLSEFGDTIAVPLAAGLRFRATPKLLFEAAFSFPIFYNKFLDDGTNTDARVLVVSTAIAL